MKKVKCPNCGKICFLLNSYGKTCLVDRKGLNYLDPSLDWNDVQKDFQQAGYKLSKSAYIPHECKKERKNDTSTGIK